jgi:hypothetical protein
MPLYFNAPYLFIPLVMLCYFLFNAVWLVYLNVFKSFFLFGGGETAIFSVHLLFFEHNKGIKQGLGVHTAYSLFIQLAYRFLEAGARTLNQLVDLFSLHMI